MMITIRLKSNDNVIFEVDYEVAIISKTIKLILDLWPKTKLDTIIIPLEIHSFILNKVVQWMEHYKEFYKQNNYILNEILQERFTNYDAWDEQFFRLNVQILRPIASIAAYLKIKGLSKQICYRISALMHSGTLYSTEDCQMKLAEEPSDHSSESTETRKRRMEDSLQSIETSKRPKPA